MLRKTPASMDERRSRVRVRITYFAAGFLFIGGAALIAVLLLVEDDTAGARQLFSTILPISASVIAYWFGTRGTGVTPEKPEKPEKPNDENSTRRTNDS